jgi:hydrogenase expression/formation protein HypD
MKYIDEFRDKALIAKVADEIRKCAGRRGHTFMEVCGTHTMAIFRYGLRDLLPGNIRLLSGPGCPVCVTPTSYLDKAIFIAGLENVTVATFGDMMRVPGSRSNLDNEKAKGASIKTVYSTDDALEIARRDPGREVVFLGVGFETTAPTVAASIVRAKREGIKNYSVLCGHKTMPEVLGVLVKDNVMDIDGFLLPGHVSTIIGTKPYEFLASDYGKRCVVAGFEPLDIMQAILMLVDQGSPSVEVQYKRVMKRSGNVLAQRMMGKVFDKTAAAWRGIGKVDGSGLKINKEFSSFDAEVRFHPKAAPVKEPKGCLCGEVLKGVKTPVECRFFVKACNPEHPVGACMVSSEGACAAYYRYGDRV